MHAIERNVVCNMLVSRQQVGNIAQVSDAKCETKEAATSRMVCSVILHIQDRICICCLRWACSGRSTRYYKSLDHQLHQGPDFERTTIISIITLIPAAIKHRGLQGISLSISNIGHLRSGNQGMYSKILLGLRVCKSIIPLCISVKTSLYKIEFVVPFLCITYK